jgi:hypothetical protein
MVRIDFLQWQGFDGQAGEWRQQRWVGREATVVRPEKVHASAQYRREMRCLEMCMGRRACRTMSDSQDRVGGGWQLTESRAGGNEMLLV